MSDLRDSILEKSYFDCWHNGDYIDFFLRYLQNHVYIKSKNIVKDFFNEIEPNSDILNEYYRKFINRQIRCIKKALDLGYIEHYNNFTYKQTNKVQDPDPLKKELKKMKFKNPFIPSINSILGLI